MVKDQRRQKDIYTPLSSGSLAKVAIDGVYQANTDQRMKWIGPNECYTVSP